VSLAAVINILGRGPGPLTEFYRATAGVHFLPPTHRESAELAEQLIADTTSIPTNPATPPNRLHFQDCLSHLYLWPTRSAARPIRPLSSASPLQKRLVHSALAFIPTPSAIAQTLRPRASPPAPLIWHSTASAFLTETNRMRAHRTSLLIVSPALPWSQNVRRLLSIRGDRLRFRC
jgi:hypothetical protein